MKALAWPIMAALVSAGLNGVIGTLALVRSRGQVLYRALGLMSLSFSLWSLAYVRCWPDFSDPFWMSVMFSPLAWLPGASLDFVWTFTQLPPEKRRLRTLPLYTAGLTVLVLLWLGRVSLQQYRAAFILGGLPIFGLALGLLAVHWWKAPNRSERNRRGYLLLASAIAVAGGFTDFLPAYGIPFLSLANVALVAYSLLVLAAIQRHHLLDLRAAAGQAAALIGAAGLLGLLMTVLASLTVMAEGALFINFFVMSLGLLWGLPPVWKGLNRAFNRPYQAMQEARERGLESLERALEEASSLDVIERAARGAVESVWGASSCLLLDGSELRDIPSDRRLDEAFKEALEADPQVHTAAGLERGAHARHQRLLQLLHRRGMRAVVPVMRGDRLAGALLIGQPGKAYFDLSGVRWLRRLGKALERALQKAELVASLIHSDRLAQMGAMAAGIAHEIRNPLSAMKGAVELLGMDVPPEQKESFLRILKDEIERLSDILTELLEYASPRTRKARCEWTEVWSRVERLLCADLPVKFKLESGGKPAELGVAAAHLQQIFLNLVKNAAAALSEAEAPEIRVTMETRGSFVLLQVADNGPGIPDEVLGRLFTPFASERAGGTGLGLAAVRRLAELYEGRAWAENAKEGARFFVELPLAS